jgi:anti-anti-sigma regulatory factor
LLGWDLDDKSVQELREARTDREKGNKNAYIDLDSL